MPKAQDGLRRGPLRQSARIIPRRPLRSKFVFHLSRSRRPRHPSPAPAPSSAPPGRQEGPPGPRAARPHPPPSDDHSPRVAPPSRPEHPSPANPGPGRRAASREFRQPCVRSVPVPSCMHQHQHHSNKLACSVPLRVPRKLVRALNGPCYSRGAYLTLRAHFQPTRVSYAAGKPVALC